MEDLICSITKGKFEFPSDLWADISPKAIDLVVQCLTLDPNIRITAARALEHPWIVNKKLKYFANFILIIGRKTFS